MKKDSKIFRFILLFFMVFAISGCKKSESIKIGFLFNSDITYRFVIESNHFAERARQLGAEVIVKHANNNASLQYEMAMQMKEEGIDLLTLIYINEITADAIVRDMKADDIPVIAYNRLIPNSDLDMFIAGNNVTLGEAMTGFVTKLVPRGNYMLFGGDKFDRNAIELQAAIDSVLEPMIARGDIKVLYKTFTENWDGRNAAFELRQFMQNSEERPDVIISCFDGMSHSMIEVLKDWDLDGKVLFTGQDAQIESVRDIVAGKQHMTMYHPFKEIGYTAAEVAVAMAKGEKLDKFNIVYTDNGLKKVPTIQINSIPVTQNDIDRILIDGGVYTRDEVYQ